MISCSWLWIITKTTDTRDIVTQICDVIYRFSVTPTGWVFILKGYTTKLILRNQRVPNYPLHRFKNPLFGNCERNLLYTDSLDNITCGESGDDLTFSNFFYKKNLCHVWLDSQVQIVSVSCICCVKVYLLIMIRIPILPPSPPSPPPLLSLHPHPPVNWQWDRK